MVYAKNIQATGINHYYRQSSPTDDVIHVMIMTAAAKVEIEVNSELFLAMMSDNEAVINNLPSEYIRTHDLSPSNETEFTEALDIAKLRLGL